MASEKGVPSEVTLLEKTWKDPVNDVDQVGEITDSLSDISDQEEDGRLLFRTRNPYLSTWLGRLRPLVRNRNVRVFSITNLVLILINVILLLLLIALFVYALIQFIMAEKYSSVDKPCLFHWSEWSECSDPCAQSATHQPVKTRKVLCNTIVRARGKYAKTAPCPEDLRTMVDTAPCNTHRCPLKLSEIGWRKDKHGRDVKSFIDLTDKDKCSGDSGEKKCYQIRDVPIGDFLIEIDVPDLTEAVHCDCASPAQTSKI